jgi:hypothetical protein
MPRGDRTGPNGQGPLTGRRMRFCTGNRPPRYFDDPLYVYGGGRGFGRGRGYSRGIAYGRGRGYGRNPDFFPLPPMPLNYYEQPLTEEENVKYLESQVEYLREGLDKALESLSDYKAKAEK